MANRRRTSQQEYQILLDAIKNNGDPLLNSQGSIIRGGWETIAATVTIEINRAISWTTVKGWWVKLRQEANLTDSTIPWARELLETNGFLHLRADMWTCFPNSDTQIGRVTGGLGYIQSEQRRWQVQQASPALTGSSVQIGAQPPSLSTYRQSNLQPQQNSPPSTPAEPWERGRSRTLPDASSSSRPGRSASPAYAQHRQRRSSSNVRAQSAMGQQPFAAGTGATTHPSSLLPLSPGSRGFYPITPNPYTYLPRPPPGHQRVLADGQYFEYNPNEQVITDPGPTHFVEVAYAPWSSSFHTSNSTSFSPPFNAFSYARTPSPPPPTNYREGNSWFSPAKFKVKSRRDENSDKNDNLSVSVKKLSTSEAKN